MSTTIGSLIAELGLDDSAYRASLQQSYSHGIKVVKDLEKQFGNVTKNIKLDLKPDVDHKPLKDLNKHFDIKQQHAKDLQTFFDRNPLTPRFDSSELKGSNYGSTGLSTGGSTSVDKAEDKIITSNDGLIFSIDRLTDSVRSIEKSNEKLPIKISKSIYVSSKESLGDKIINLPARVMETVITGSLEGVGQQLAFDFTTGAQKYVEAKTGTSASTLGKDFGRYAYGRGKGFAMVGANALGYTGLKEVAEDLKYIGDIVDGLLDPRKFAARAKKIEDLMVAMLEDVDVYNDPKQARDRFNEAVKPQVESIKESGVRAAGVGLRAVAQPFRIRKRVKLAQSMEIAREYADRIQVPELEDPENTKTIALTTGGVSMEKGAPNTYFSSNMLKGLLGPGVATVPVPNVFSNNADEMGNLFELRKELLANIINTLKKDKDWANQFGLNKEGGISTEDLENPLQFDKMLQIAIESGYNPDAIAMEATRLAYEKKYSDKNFIFAGTSAGTIAAEEATAIAERGGAKNVKGFGATMGLTGMTQTASKENFKAFVGDLDPLFAAMFGRESLGSLSDEQKEFMWEKMNSAEGMPFPAEMMRGMNEYFAGLMRPSDNTEVIKGAGVGHNLAQFLSDPEFQKQLLVFLKDYIEGVPETMKGRRGSSPFKATTSNTVKAFNQMYASPKGMHFEDLQRTLSVLEGDEKAIADVKAGAYSFFDPDTQKLTKTYGDSQEKPDLGYAAEEMRSSKFKKESELPQFVKDKIESFKRVFELINEVVNESGDIDYSKVEQAKIEFLKAYGEAPILPDIVSNSPETMEAFSRLSKQRGGTSYGSDDLAITDTTKVAEGDAGAIFTNPKGEKAFKVSKDPMRDLMLQIIGTGNTVGREAYIQGKVPSELAGKVHEKGKDYSVQELLKGMDLGKLMKSAQESGNTEEILKYISHMGRLLKNLHEAKITHGDFHPGNVFSVDTEQGEAIKAIDFGYSQLDANKDAIKQDLSRAINKIKGKTPGDGKGYVDIMELDVDVNEAIDAFMHGYKGKTLEPLSRPPMEPKTKSSSTRQSITKTSTIGDVPIQKVSDPKIINTLSEKLTIPDTPDTEGVLVSNEEIKDIGSSLALSFVKGVGDGLTNVAETAGTAMAESAEKGAVNLINRLMRRVPGDPNAIDVTAPTIEKISDIGPEQIAKASSLGIEDAANVLGQLAKAGASAALSLGKITVAIGGSIKGAQPAANQFVGESRKQLGAAKDLLGNIQLALGSGELGDESVRGIKMLAGTEDASGYITKMLADVENAIAQLPANERTKPLLGNQLANLKSQIIKIEKQLSQLVGQLDPKLLESGSTMAALPSAETTLDVPASASTRTLQLQSAQPPPNYKAQVRQLGLSFSDQLKGARSAEDPQQAAQIAQDIINQSEIARKALSDLLENLGDDADQGLKNLVSAARQRITKSVKSASKITEDSGIGQNIGDGISQGFDTRKSIGDVQKSVRDLAQASIDTAEDTLEIESPSKVFKRIGQFSVEGFSQGLSEFGDTFKDLYYMADLYQTNLRKAFDSSVISAELEIVREDLSELWTSLGRIANLPNESIINKYKSDVRSNAHLARSPEGMNMHPTGENIPKNAKQLVFVSSGFTGTRGKISNEIAEKTNRLSPKGTHTIPFESQFDVSGTLDQVGISKVVRDAILEPMKAVFQGYNTEAMRLAKQVYSAHQQNPDADIKMVGHSAGGFVVREAQEILKHLGVVTEALSMGTPLLGAFEAIKDDAVSLMGEFDQLRIFSGQKEAIVPGVGGHFSPEYLDNSNEMRELLSQYLEDGITPSLIKKIHELGEAIKGLEPGKSGSLMRFDRKRVGQQNALTGDTGKYVGEGFAQGLGDAVQTVEVAAVELAETAIEAAEDALGISSPSKVFKKIGEYIVEGLIVGINTTKSKVSPAINSIKENAVKGFKNVVLGPDEQNTDPGFEPFKVTGRRPEQDIPIIGEAFSFVLDSLESMKQAATFIPTLGRSLAEVFEGLMSNTGAILGLAKGALVFNFIVKPLLGALTQFESISFGVAVELDNMARMITFVSGSAREGARNIDFIREKVLALGGDVKTSMAGFAQLAASSQGTRLEGEGTRQLFGAISQASAVYQLAPEQQDRAFTATAQMLDKTVVSAEELRGQLAEALPGSLGVAARALGTTTQELGQMMSTGQIMAEDLLPKFAQQLSAETSSGIAGSADSAQSAINRLNNEVIFMQEAFGKTVMPVRVTGIKVATEGMKFLRENVEILAPVLTAVFGTLIKSSIVGLIKLASTFKPLQAVIAKLTPLIASLFINLLKNLKAFAAQFARTFILIQGATDLFSIFSKALSDTSGGIRDLADISSAGWEDYTKSLEDAIEKQKELNEVTNNNKGLSGRERPQGNTITGLTQGESLLESTLLGSILPKELVRGFERSVQIGGGFRTFENVKAENQTLAIGDLIGAGGRNTSEAMRILGGGSYATEDGMGSLGQVTKLDEQLKTLQQQRSGLDIGESDKRRKLEEDINSLLEKRQTLYAPIGKIQRNLTQDVENYKNAIKVVEEELNRPGLSDERRSTLENQKSVLNAELNMAQKQLDGINTAIGQSVNKMILLGRELSSIAANLERSKFFNQLSAGEQNISLANARLNGASQGETDYTRSLIQKEQLSTQVSTNQSYIQQYENTLNADEFVRTLENAGLALDATSFEIEEALTRLSDTNLGPDLGKIAEYKGKVEGLQLDTLNLEEQMIQAQIQANEQVRNANREIEEYFRSVAEQSDELALQVQEVSSNTKFNEIKSALKSSMSGLSGTFFDDWLGGFMEFLDTLNGMVQTRIDADRQAQQLAQQQLQSQMQSAQMGRSLPGNVQGVFNTGNANYQTFLTGTLAAQEYGASRDGGSRRHAGQDFDLAPDDKFESYIGGQVTRVGSNPGGYGNYIDVYNSALGVVERIAELDTLFVSLGDVIQAGQTVGQGTRDTGVVHYEIRTDLNAQNQGGFGFGGTVDPINYLENLGIVQRNGTQVVPQTQPVQTATGANITRSTGSSLPSLGGGYGSLESLASTLSQNNNFDTSSAEGRAAMALALGIGGSEVYSQGSTQQDFFTRRGGTGNNMLGFGQFNMAYHRDRTDSPDEYMDFMGSILRGQSALPNGRQGRNFAGELAQLIQTGGITSGQQLIEFTQSGGNSGLGGSNWQGIDDGWSRVPGLADSLVSYLQGSSGSTNMSSGVNTAQFQGGQQLNDQNFQLQQNLLDQSTQSQLQLANIEANLQAQGVVSQSNRQSQDLQDQTLEFQQQIQDRTISALPEGSESRSQIGGLIDNARQDASGITNTSRQRQRFQQQLDAAGPLREAAMLARTQKVDQVAAGLIDPSQIENIDIQITGLDKIIEDATNALNVLNELDSGTIDFAFAQESINLDTQIEQLSIAGNKLSPVEAATVELRREVEALEANMDSLTDVYRQSQIEAGHTGENLEILVSKFEDTNNIRLDNAREELERLEEAARSAQEAALIEIRTEGLGELTRVLNRSGQPQQAQELNYQNQLRQIDNDERNRLQEIEADPRLSGNDPEDIEMRARALNEARETFSNRRENAAFDNEMQTRERDRNINGELLNSRSAVLNAYSERYSGNLPSSMRDEQESIALELQSEAYKKQIDDLRRLQDQVGLTDGQFTAMLANIEELNQVEIGNIKTEFSDIAEVIEQARQPMKDALTSWLQGTKSFNEAFGDMINNIMNNIISLMANKIVDGFIDNLIGGLTGGDDSGGGGESGGSGGGGLVGAIAALFGGGFNDGGKVGSSRSSMAYQGLDNIKSALKREGPKGRIIVANTEEWVLNKDHQKMLAEYGITDKQLGFKGGGKVGSSPSITVPNGNSSVSVSMPLTVNNQGNSDVDAAELLKSIKDPVRSLISTEIERQQRPKGQLRRRR